MSHEPFEPLFSGFAAYVPVIGAPHPHGGRAF
jgi:hypothetical protein